MEKENMLFKKPRQLIRVTHPNITLTQRKAYNYIFFRAKEQLMKNNSQMLFTFSYAEIETAIGGNDTNNKRLYEDLMELRKVEFEIFKDIRNWAVFNLFSEVLRVGDKLQIQLPSTICNELLKGSYRTIDLMEIKALKNKYALIFYEIFQDQLNDDSMKFPVWSINEFKELLGIEGKKTYSNFAELTRKILNPALKDLADEKGIYLGYDAKKTGKQYTSIQFKLIGRGKDTLDCDAHLNIHGDVVPGVEQYKLITDEQRGKNTELKEYFLNIGFSSKLYDDLFSKYDVKSLEFARDILKKKSKSGIEDMVAYGIGVIQNCEKSLDALIEKKAKLETKRARKIQTEIDYEQKRYDELNAFKTQSDPKIAEIAARLSKKPI
jgi:plasmid replication initiation protein